MTAFTPMDTPPPFEAEFPEAAAQLAAAYRNRPLPLALRLGLREIRPKLNVGRNDPCPCGSGKKFKKCCAS